jgi:hypothetical protein
MRGQFLAKRTDGTCQLVPAEKLAKAGGPSASELEPNPYIMPLVYAQLSEAMNWIRAAELTLDRARDYLQGTSLGGLPALAQRASIKWAIVNDAFHLDKLAKPQALREIDRIKRIFAEMRACIGHHSAATEEGSGYFQMDPTKDNRADGPFLAFTYYGGWTRRNPRTGLPRMSKEDNYEGANLREDAIYIATETIDPTPLKLTGLIIHELAHFVGPEINSGDRIGDHSYTFKANFSKLSPYLAVRTADCYSYFAAEAQLNMS